MEQGSVVGFIGLGNMGLPMARNLLRADWPLVIWNRTEAKGQELRDAGAAWADSPRAVAEESDVVLTVLADAAAVNTVLLGEDGVGRADREGLIVVEMSTIAPSESVAVAEALERRGMTMLDAPLSGSTQAAADAALTVLVGGDKTALETVRPVLEAVGKTVYHMGKNGTGCYMKLVNNVLLGAILGSFAEAYVMGQKGGLDGAQMLDVILHGSGRCPLLESKGKAIVERDFAPTFAFRMMEKDLTLAMKTAADVEAPMPLTAVLNEIHRMGLAHGRGEDDFSAIARVYGALAATE